MRGRNPWSIALKAWNDKRKADNPADKCPYIIPKKGSDDYNAVMAMTVSPTPAPAPAPAPTQSRPKRTIERVKHTVEYGRFVLNPKHGQDNRPELLLKYKTYLSNITSEPGEKQKKDFEKGILNKLGPEFRNAHKVVVEYQEDVEIPEPDKPIPESKDRQV